METIRPELKTNLYIAADLALNTMVTRLLTQPAVALAPNLRRRFVRENLNQEVSLRVSAKRRRIYEQDLGVEVVRGYLTEGGDSILGAFF